MMSECFIWRDILLSLSLSLSLFLSPLTDSSTTYDSIRNTVKVSFFDCLCEYTVFEEQEQLLAKAGYVHNLIKQVFAELMFLVPITLVQTTS